MNLSPFSSYHLAPIVKITDVYGRLLEPLHLGQRPTLVRIVFTDSTYYRPSEGERWTQIAYRLLGDGSYYWAIADCSGVVDLFTALRPETTYCYQAQLALDIPAGTVTTAKLNRTRGLDNSARLRITDLANTSATMDVSVQAVDAATGIVTFAPTVSPGIPAVRSRVAKAVRKDVVLTVPSAHRFRFDIADFGNKLNVVTE